MTPEQWKEFDKWPAGVCIDPHPRKSFAMAWYKVDPTNRIIIFEEWPATSYYETPGPQWGVGGYADKIKAIEMGDNFHEHPIESVLWRILDPNYGRSMSVSGRTLQEEFEDFGLAFDCQVSDRIEPGHIAVQGMLQDPPQLLVTPNCKNIILAFERYVHAEYTKNASEINQKETPREEYKDFMDVVRYIVMSKPRYFDLSQKPERFIPQDMGLR